MSESAYARAGVDIEAGDRAVELMKAHVARTRRPEVLGGLGGFAGFFDASALTYEHPVLATSTDGVGTKVAIAQALDKHDTIGFDLIGMLVDDLVVVGAEPLFVTDYIACGKVVPERIAAIVGHRGRLRGGRCGPPGRRDRRASRPAGARRVRRGRRHHRRRRAQPHPRTRPGPPRRRGRGAGVLGPALQRLLAGAARAADRCRLVVGAARRRTRPHPRRGTARPRPGCTRATSSP